MNGFYNPVDYQEALGVLRSCAGVAKVYALFDDTYLGDKLFNDTLLKMHMIRHCIKYIGTFHFA
jgi:hypothetical protein